MKNILLVILLPFFVYSQESIQTDRPDQTETPFLTPVKKLQVETGFSYQKINTNNKEYNLPSILWKYGLSENFEIRLITGFQKNENFKTYTNGVTPVLIGCKIRISEENGFLPKTSFIGHLELYNLAKKEYKNNYMAPEFRFVMQHTLNKKFSFSYNLGAEWNGLSAEATYIYTASLGYSITEKLGSYLELYGFAPEKQIANHNFDCGFTYLISNDFMLDFSTGFGITNNATKYFYSIGFSFRI